MRRLAKLHLSGHKGAEDSVPARMPVPPEVTIPMLMHIGAPARPVVKPGDEVRVYELLAEADGPVSAPIHSGVSGTVKRIEDVRLSSGRQVPAIVIATDGKQTAAKTSAPSVTSFDGFIAAVRDSGVVGLGGAGFPTAVKLTIGDPARCAYIIVNGAECEPYATADARTMLDEQDLVWSGVLLLKRYFPKARVIIAIEDNKPACVEAFRKRCAPEADIEVAALRSRYPQGGEKMIIHETTGRVVPENKLPIDVGVLVVNCATIAAVARYVETGVPLVERCVTVGGSAAARPQNVIAPIGTPLSALFDFCGGFAAEPGKVLCGGPMMGVAAASLEEPLTKTTNCVLALNQKEAQLPPETTCIRCGRCVDYCPMHLMPLDIETAYQLRRADLLERYKVALCIECGCCAYVCPSRRRLVQVMKLGKPLARAYRNEQKARQEKEAKEQ